MNLSRASRQAGFTMVEILAALAIMGMMASVVVMTLPGDDRAFRNEVKQLAARLEMAAEESIVTGRSLGFAISNDGYSFQQISNGAWAEIEQNRVFGRHDWSGATFVDFDRSTFFPREEEETEDSEAKTVTPLMSFDPTGLAAQFSIRLERGESRYVLRGEGREVEMSDAGL